MESSFSPAEGVEVIYKKYRGIIRFVGEDYLTLCVQTRTNDMISDVCLLIYKEDWNVIELIKRSDR